MPAFIAITLISLVTLRLFYGIDFSDEAYWIAMASNFANGARPFVDELIIHQTPFILISPLVKLWHAYFGNEGIILYCRFLFLFMNLGVALAIHSVLRKRLARPIAFGVALAFPLIVPLQIPNLSYNSIGAAFFALALFLALDKRNILAGVCHGLATIAYPTLAVPALAHLLLFHRAVSTRERLTTLAVYFSVPALFLSLYFPFPHFESIVYTLTAWDHGGGFPKIFTVFRHFFYDNVPLPVYGMAFAILAVRTFIPRLLPWVAFLFFPVLYLCFQSAMYTQMWIVFYGALLAPLFIIRDRQELLRQLWLPSFVAAITIGWSSMSAPINGVIGFVPAFLVLVISLLGHIGALPALSRSLSTYAVHALLVLGLFSGKAFYRDGDFRDLFARVSSGPFRGLVTTAFKHRYLSEVTFDIKRYENNQGKVLFFEFPAGYLISSMPPATNSLWIRTQSKGSAFYRDRLVMRSTLQDRIFVFHWITHDWDKTYAVHYNAKDPLVQHLLTHYSAIVQRENYTILEPLLAPHKKTQPPAAIPIS